ncbi:GCN5-related N-acetyltransferase 6, chloroplastic isoform X2 [Cryptomeria japonica]|uniref:GCN5-related N-acetyltransferase 6, chloroplastic isoform X2 n=1 Tax=Cryptomeria japonica TaxID=3369 RepID=UPI0025AC149B|nr:GCN5-related N-acetyltransferase 6, chloroplastic isoform X2 [Cryptomeria japonica]
MLKSPGLMYGGMPVLHCGKRREAAFAITSSISPVRQRISKKRTWKCAIIRCSNSAPGVQDSTTPQVDTTGLSDLSFDRLQPTDQDCKTRYRKVFGNFVAREAILDEEYWQHGCVQKVTGRTSDIFVMWIATKDNLQNSNDSGISTFLHASNRPADRSFILKEFNALKRRCFGRDGHYLKCFCIVAVKKEVKIKRRIVLNSIVGTLDLSIRQLLQGETFPGEQAGSSIYMSGSKSGCSHRYGYVANVCVAKFARRQGIGSNMLQLAIEIAKSSGLKDVFVHVNTNNKIAQQLYRNIGFKVVEAATSNSLGEQKQLLLLEHQI